MTGRPPDEPIALSTNAAYVGWFCYYLGQSAGRPVRLQVGSTLYSTLYDRSRRATVEGIRGVSSFTAILH